MQYFIDPNDSLEVVFKSNKIKYGHDFVKTQLLKLKNTPCVPIFGYWKSKSTYNKTKQ